MFKHRTSYILGIAAVLLIFFGKYLIPSSSVAPGAAVPSDPSIIPGTTPETTYSKAVDYSLPIIPAPDYLNGDLPTPDDLSTLNGDGTVNGGAL